METVCAVNLVSDTLKLNTAYRNSVNNADYIVQSYPIRIVQHHMPSICIKTAELGVSYFFNGVVPDVGKRVQCLSQAFFWRRYSEIPDFHDSFR